MQLQQVPDDPVPSQPPEVVATIGKFDGVHRGHQALVAKVVERAVELGVQSAVVIFEPHPTRVIRPDVPLHLLTTAEDKAELLAGLGIDHVLVWRFDHETQHTSAERFLELLNRRVRLRRLVHGPGFAIGYKRQGTAPVIAAIGARIGFDVEEVASVAYVGMPEAGSDEELVTSTAIRQWVEAGRVKHAAAALGHCPTVTGWVVEGERVGRTLGFPTANLALDGPAAVPADGVYAAWAELEPYTARSRQQPAAASVGMRPTFDGQRRVVEAHLLDFAGNLYGQRMRLHFVARLRGQERFADVAALVVQMREDVAVTRRVLGEEATPAEEEVAADG